LLDVLEGVIDAVKVVSVKVVLATITSVLVVAETTCLTRFKVLPLVF
jgi:hypothetical protein